MLHPHVLLASLEYAYSPCVLPPFLRSCALAVVYIFFTFLLFLLDFDLDIVCFIQDRCLFLVGIMLSPRFRFPAATRLAYDMYLDTLIRTYADLTFFVRGICCSLLCLLPSESADSVLFVSLLRGNRPPQSYWSLSFDHGLHCCDEFM